MTLGLSKNQRAFLLYWPKLMFVLKQYSNYTKAILFCSRKHETTDDQLRLNSAVLYPYYRCLICKQQGVD